jgi:TIR domain
LELLTLLEEIDWAIVDIGERMAATGIPAYLHGRFIPLIRLKYTSQGIPQAANSPFESALFGGVEVGYFKDILVWNDVVSLQKGLDQRLLSLKAGVKRISTAEEATIYFRGAALRKEAVFLSYSGKDRDIAADLRVALKKRFQEVFDYRDGESIRSGQPWLKEIFDQLSSSALGIPLLSQSYFESGNCMHEAEQMVAQLDSKKMKLIPIKLYNEALQPPSWLQSIQYLRRSEYGSPDDIAKELVQLITT